MSAEVWCVISAQFVVILFFFIFYFFNHGYCQVWEKQGKPIFTQQIPTSGQIGNQISPLENDPELGSGFQNLARSGSVRDSMQKIKNDSGTRIGGNYTVPTVFQKKKKKKKKKKKLRTRRAAPCIVSVHHNRNGLHSSTNFAGIVLPNHLLGNPASFYFLVSPHEMKEEIETKHFEHTLRFWDEPRCRASLKRSRCVCVSPQTSPMGFFV